jgi:hypothetical protein
MYYVKLNYTFQRALNIIVVPVWESTGNCDPCIYPPLLNTKDPNICCCKYSVCSGISRQSVFELCGSNGVVHAASELGGTRTIPKIECGCQWKLVCRGWRVAVEIMRHSILSATWIPLSLDFEWQWNLSDNGFLVSYKRKCQSVVIRSGIQLNVRSTLYYTKFVRVNCMTFNTRSVQVRYTILAGCVTLACAG